MPGAGDTRPGSSYEPVILAPVPASWGYRAKYDGWRDGPLVAAVVIGGVFLLGMVAAAGYAARTLPSGARVPLNAGMPEYSLWLPKFAGLAAWLGVGVAAFAAVALVTLSGVAANWATSLRVVLLPCAMMIVLAAETGAVISARQRYVDGRTPAAVSHTGPDATPEGTPEAALGNE
jgi:hypothetical protein